MKIVLIALNLLLLCMCSRPTPVVKGSSPVSGQSEDVAKPPSPKSTDTAEAPKAEALEDQVETFLPKFQAELEEKGSNVPNSYQVKIHWEDPGISEGWQLVRTPSAESAATIATLTSSVTSFTDTQVEAGRTYSYTLSRVVDSQPSQVGVLTMRVPRDLDCSSQLNWSDYRTAFYRRIFLQPDCVILWGSEASEINTDQIHSLGGKLESFPEGSSSNTDKPGLSGGTLKIHARSGSGKVTVYSRGLDGSPGGIRSELLGSDSPEHAYNIALRFASAGGSAGSVHAKIDEDAPIYFDVRSIPGLSGAVDDFKNTPSTPYLPKGGISAKNGADGKICIEIGKSRTGDCG